MVDIFFKGIYDIKQGIKDGFVKIDVVFVDINCYFDKSIENVWSFDFIKLIIYNRGRNYYRFLGVFVDFYIYYIQYKFCSNNIGMYYGYYQYCGDYMG